MQRAESFEADSVVELQLKIDDWIKNRPSYTIVSLTPFPQAGNDDEASNYQVIVIYET